MSKKKKEKGHCQRKKKEAKFVLFCFKREVAERAKGEEERKNRKKKEKSFSSTKRRVTALESVLSGFFLRCSSPSHLVQR